jgi:hypothetical protein
MTRLYIDKQEIGPLPPDLHSLDQVLKLVENTHLSPNAIIRQIHVDGRPWLQDDQAACLPVGVGDRETIEIVTGTLQEVALDSIREAITYLDRVGLATPSLASSFRAAAGREAFESLKQFYEGFYWMNLLLDRLERTFRIPLETMCMGGGNARDYHAKLAEALKGIIEAHEQNDFGLVADLLEYEIAAMIPACKDMFAAIRARILPEQ